MCILRQVLSACASVLRTTSLLYTGGTVLCNACRNTGSNACSTQFHTGHVCVGSVRHCRQCGAESLLAHPSGHHGSCSLLSFLCLAHEQVCAARLPESAIRRLHQRA